MKTINIIYEFFNLKYKKEEVEKLSEGECGFLCNNSSYVRRHVGNVEALLNNGTLDVTNHWIRIF